MEPTKQEAEAMLAGAGGVESAVRARAPQEHPVYFWAGLTLVPAGLILDINRGGDSDSMLATVVGMLALAALTAFVVVHVLYWRRYRQVRRRRTPTRLEWALAAWGAAALFGLGVLLAGTIGFAFTLGGIVGAMPTVLWAERLRHTR